MRGRISKIVSTMVMAVMLFSPADGFAKNGKRLVTINAVEYTSDDFVNWWQHWNDKNSTAVFPTSPDDFIDFQLLVQQGQEMGYDSKPGYLRKLDVFLQVRAMMALKYEEVDSKINITDEDLRKYFSENYADVWNLQILAFDSEEKARKAYEYMLPHKGQASGRLVFSDLYGGAADEKADTYDEVNVSAADFHKNKRKSWLEIVRKLANGEVGQPFFSEDKKKYVLIRLIEKSPAAAEVFEEKKQRMLEALYKEQKNRLTAELIEKLKKKYNLKIDAELLGEVKLGVDYPKDFLDRKLVEMTGFEATVGDFIYNAVKEKSLRKGIADEVVMGMVLDTIISQTLINKESLARGYEKRPPLLATYEFYKQNRLKAEVETELLGGIALTEQDLLNYYSANIASFSVPDEFVFLILEGTEDVLKKVWVGTLQGGDVDDLAQKYSVKAVRQNQKSDSLAPALVAELKKLDKGEVSSPFVLGATYALAKLIEHVPGQVRPFTQVKGDIHEQLKKAKFETVKAEYIAKLKSRSRIDVNDRVWSGLVREYGKKKE